MNWVGAGWARSTWPSGQFDQQVALKLVKRGMDSEAVLRRFLAERQILASLHTPTSPASSMVV